MGKRQDSRERIEAQIRDAGRRQLVTIGAAGLSLRAIARELGMVSSAIYRYVPSRDDLLTALLVDAYTDLADRVDDARSAATGGWRAELDAMAHAVRGWALDAPASWALLYGSPVPGYQAPPEVTVVPGTRVVGAVLDVVSAGLPVGASGVVVPQELSRDFARLRDEYSMPDDDPAVARCFTFWAGLIGAISLEVFGQYGADTLTDPGQLFEIQLRLLTDMLEFGPPADANGPPSA